jgi:hypothetical protein
MSKQEEFRSAKARIKQETDAEIAFGEYLERSGVDCDVFMQEWRIDQNQFNAISHYLYGLTDNVSMLPSALAAMLVLIANRQPVASILEKLPSVS